MSPRSFVWVFVTAGLYLYSSMAQLKLLQGPLELMQLNTNTNKPTTPSTTITSPPTSPTTTTAAKQTQKKNRGPMQHLLQKRQRVLAERDQVHHLNQKAVLGPQETPPTASSSLSSPRLSKSTKYYKYNTTHSQTAPTKGRPVLRYKKTLLNQTTERNTTESVLTASSSSVVNHQPTPTFHPVVQSLLKEKPISSSSGESVERHSLRHLSPPVSIYLWPNVTVDDFQHNTLGYLTWAFEMKHYTIEGIDRSPFLTRVYDDGYRAPNLVWMVDFSQGKRPSRWCYALMDALKASLQKNPNKPPLVILDWRDEPWLPSQYQYCSKIYDLWGPNNIHVVKRSQVEGRHWNATLQKVEPGFVNDTYWSSQSKWSTAPIRTMNYGVRTDLLETMRQIVSFGTIHNDTTTMTSRKNPTSPSPRISNNNHNDDWADLPRPYDVAHYWPTPQQQEVAQRQQHRKATLPGIVNRGSPEENNSQWRDKVSQSLLEWNQSVSNVTAFVGLAGSAVEAGRLAAQTPYATSLLQHKIVVVCQKDDWEDHYRLMEALVSGALVFTDSMVQLPDRLVDGHNIVVYRSLAELREKLEYYLWTVDRPTRVAVARRGRQVALTQHRSWHLMEKIVFGRILSSSSSSSSTRDGTSSSLSTTL